MSSGGLKAVFLSERPMLLRLLSSRLGDPDLAQDLLQELWLKLESTATGPLADPAAYLFRMAANLALDHRRSTARRIQREQGWSEVQPTHSEYATAEDTLISRERLGEMERSIAALPERTAAIFRSYRFDGVSRKEIAADLAISVSAVEKHLQRAYRAIHILRDADGVDVALP
jgi:RNA polymerase sigma-70 factor (ECF subfamily)